MIDYGVVKSVSIGTDKDTDNNKYICEVEFSDAEDVRTIQVMNKSGINSKPLPGHKVVVLDIGGGFEVGICSDDEIVADLEDGETEIYAIDGISKSSKIRLFPDGSIVINDGTNFMVRYNEMATAVNEINDKLNAHIGKYNYHLHLGTVDSLGGACVLTSPTASGDAAIESTADITTSKIEEIFVP